jgi:hypothetical protein
MKKIKKKRGGGRRKKERKEKKRKGKSELKERLGIGVNQPIVQRYCFSLRG